MREVLNAIRYLVRSGCVGTMLPIHFPPWQTVHWWFRRLARRLMFRTIHDIVVMIDRALLDRASEPTAAVIDGRAVDTDGRLLLVHLTPANISDSAGAQAVLDALHSKWPWIKQLLADSAYD